MLKCDHVILLTIYREYIASKPFLILKVLSYLFKTINFMSKIKRKSSSFSLGQCSINPVQVITVFPLAPKFWENFNRQSSTLWGNILGIMCNSEEQIVIPITQYWYGQAKTVAPPPVPFNLEKGHWIPEKVFMQFRKNFKMWKHCVTNQLLLCCQSIHIDNTLRLDLLS